MQAAAFFSAHGMPPAAGGQLDQTPDFLEVVSILQAAQSRKQQEEIENLRRKR